MFIQMSNHQNLQPNQQKNLYIEEECDRESTTLTFPSITRVCSRCVKLKREYECKETWRRTFLKIQAYKIKKQQEQKSSHGWNIFKSSSTKHANQYPYNAWQLTWPVLVTGVSMKRCEIKLISWAQVSRLSDISIFKRFNIH